MELEDRRDNLRLLALVARGLGCEDLDDYVPPSVRIHNDLIEAGRQSEAAKRRAADPGEERRQEVLRFIAETGGG